MTEQFRQIFNNGEDVVLLVTILTPTLQPQEIQDIIDSVDYQTWKQVELGKFLSNTDLLLAGKIRQIDRHLSSMSPGDKNYPALLREYGALLRTTSPLIEKLSRVKAEVDVTTRLKDLTIVLEDGGIGCAG